jgi:hypothetical protein
LHLRSFRLLGPNRFELRHRRPARAGQLRMVAGIDTIGFRDEARTLDSPGTGHFRLHTKPSSTRLLPGCGRRLEVENVADFGGRRCTGIGPHVRDARRVERNVRRAGFSDHRAIRIDCSRRRARDRTEMAAGSGCGGLVHTTLFRCGAMAKR